MNDPRILTATGCREALTSLGYLDPLHLAEAEVAAVATIIREGVSARRVEWALNHLVVTLCRRLLKHGQVDLYLHAVAVGSELSGICRIWSRDS